jgi:hypothetical protein
VWILCVDLAKKRKKKPPRKGAKSLSLLKWACEELNLGPHAYQFCLTLWA